MAFRIYCVKTLKYLLPSYGSRFAKRGISSENIAARFHKLVTSSNGYRLQIRQVSSSSTPEKSDDPEFKLSDSEWRDKLTTEQYQVCREKATERPFTGEYNNHHDTGTYTCVGCGAELFSSDAKFDAGCGWPSFSQPKDVDAEGSTNVVSQTDASLGMHRVEVLCKKCHSHLGHVFNDGPQPTGERFCINSASLKFAPKKNNHL